MDKKQQNNVDLLYQKCMSGKSTLHSNEVRRCVNAPFALYCWSHVTRDERDDIDALIQMEAEAKEKRKDSVVRPRAQGARRVILETPEQRFYRMLNAMFQGEEHIGMTHIYYKPEGMTGIVTGLEKMKGKSIFGNHYYVIVEDHMPRTIKDEDMIRVAFCNKILGYIQSHTPKQFSVINRERNIEHHKQSKYVEQLEQCIAKSISIKRGDTIPPAIHGYEKQYPWNNYANKIAMENRDITLISGISINTRQRFIDAGYKSIKKIAAATPDNLCKIEKVGPKLAKSIRAHAKALTTGKPVKLDTVELPKTRTAVYLDLESTIPIFDERISDYMIGIMVAGKYKAFVAADLGGERGMVREFLKYLGKFDDYTLYHWDKYDRKRLESMTKRYKCSREYEAHLYDLHAHSKQSWAFPVPGRSIKQVARWIGFEWKHSDVDAREAFMLYYKYKTMKDKKALRKVLDYNRDDCEAAMVAGEWLRTHQ